MAWKYPEIEASKYIKTYCYHCGKLLDNQKEKHPNYNLHIDCFSERQNLQKGVKSQIWKELMADKDIRKKIIEIERKKIKRNIKLQKLPQA